MRRRALILTTLLLVGCKDEILHGLSEVQANKAQLVLKQAGIDAGKIRDGAEWGIAVPNSLVGPALLTLDRSRVISRDLARFKEHPRGLIPSKEERSQYRERQAAWNLEQTLERLPQVLEARVHLFLNGLEDGLQRPAHAKQSAGVLLLLGQGGGVEEPLIKKIVSGATGIKPDDIEVMLTRDSAPAAESAKAAAPETAVEPWLLAAIAGAPALLLAAAVFRFGSRKARYPRGQ